MTPHPITNDTTDILPAVAGHYWLKHPGVNSGRPCVVRVEIDEFARLTAQACGDVQIFTENELDGAVWSWRIHPPISMISFAGGEVNFLDDLPF